MTDPDAPALYRCPVCGAELDGTPKMKLMCSGTEEEPHEPAPVLRAVAPRREEPTE
jgi:hypothetical protein